ncbi:error-prone DNA polymerase [Rhodanobacter denitrificans]|uniref:error-prone DNA polymerase n=1 Tax=Rhodanobacter denitrificans TaxID=666685 RepID=UPI000921740B|nr:error-prone DNA polymerase [Rhodanobacter denitrificans]UJJ53017.1 error-prone DNA polymerase [Rhodanobacter denitrificans]
MTYAELHCLSSLSFLRGVASARVLFERAAALGYHALAITDECSFAGIVRALEASRATGLPLIVGTELALEDGARLVLLAEDRAGYATLCRLITAARARAPKGRYEARWSDLEGDHVGVLALLCAVDRHGAVPAACRGWAARLATMLPGGAWLGVELHRGDRDAEALATCTGIGAATGLPLVAAGDVHMATRSQRALQDTVTTIRLGKSVTAAAGELFPNGERHLRAPTDLAALYPPALIAETLRIAARCRLDLGTLGCRPPLDSVPAGVAPAAWLRALVAEGAARRWPNGVPAPQAAQIDHELALIADLGYEAFFLTVHDIVAFARSRQILCQGRGSAANSVVCYALGITEVDPERGHLLFERFLSKERHEPPDIDVDFEHERREEVIQFIYARYGRDRAALTAAITTYRPRSAVRDVGRALDLDPDLIDRLARAMDGWGDAATMPTRLAETGIDTDTPAMRRLLVLAMQLVGTPRHLSQHVGGFVISAAPLAELVPVEPATMEGRTIIQYDKNDLSTLGLLKVDILALGMLSALRRTFDLIRRHHGVSLSMADIPAEDPATYAMLRRADTVGVFQVESRAQMAMLPRMRPQCFYDLVVQTAIIRPGPIQGGMVHPYLRRRQGREAPSYPSEAVKGVLERTLGVPIFQEQVMQLAVVAAGFSAGEADQLRRSMGAWERHGTMEHFRTRLLAGMAERGYAEHFAEQLFASIRGFGAYGFPESHAASFALLAYASAWLRAHYPAAFLAALLNAQPAGFYTRDQLLQDARRHGIATRPPDVNVSGWDSHLEGPGGRPLQPGDVRGAPVVRLGLREISGFRVDSAARLLAARSEMRFNDVADLARRAALDQRDLPLLADAGALAGLAGHRHVSRWVASGIEATLPLFGSTVEAAPMLRPPTPGEDMAANYAAMGLTPAGHPMALVRPALAGRGVATLDEARRAPHQRRMRVVGLIGLRQRPPAARGVTFLTLEDETAWLNVVVWPDLAEECAIALRSGGPVRVDGRIEHVDGVTHLIAAHVARLYRD